MVWVCCLNKTVILSHFQIPNYTRRITATQEIAMICAGIFFSIVLPLLLIGISLFIMLLLYLSLTRYQIVIIPNFLLAASSHMFRLIKWDACKNTTVIGSIAIIMD
jgi:hypothetical protein